MAQELLIDVILSEEFQPVLLLTFLGLLLLHYHHLLLQLDVPSLQKLKLFMKSVDIDVLIYSLVLADLGLLPL